MRYDPKTLIAEAITEHFGERCPDMEPGCMCCDAWAQYDAMTTDPRALVAAAYEAAAIHIEQQARRTLNGVSEEEASICANEARALTPADARAAFDAAIREAEELGTKQEREACAGIADGHHNEWARAIGKDPSMYTSTPRKIADAIRARGESE